MNKMNKEPTREELLRAFGETPPAFRAGVHATLRNLTTGKEEHIVRRKLRFAPALVLMLVLLGSVAIAASILYPRTQERFTEIYGEEFGEHLAQGDVAEMEMTYVLEDVQYTLTDIIYADGVLYGTVVMEPAEGANIVLMPEEFDVSDPYGVNIHGGEEAPEGAKSYLEVAQERGAKLIVAKHRVREELGDGNFLGSSGYFDVPTPEGTIISSFEVYGWNGEIDRSQTYTLVINPRNREWIEGNEEHDWNSGEWTVEVEPVLKTELIQTPATTPKPMTAEGAEIVVPENFTGVMPIFAVEERDFRGKMKPEWVNNSGIAAHEALEFRDEYLFADEDWLSVEEHGSLYYYAYEGTCEVPRWDGSTETMPATELSGKIARMAGDIHFHKSHGESVDYDWPPQEEPSLVTLDDARLQAETLLAKLGVEGVRLTWSYTADMANIHSLCDAYNAKIASGEWPYVEPWEDRALNPEDEGYWLIYAADVDGIPTDSSYMEAYIFVGTAGIRDFVIRAPFVLGSVVGTAEAIPAESAKAFAVDAAKESWIPELAPDLERATRIELVYVVRNKAQLVPVWRVYTTDSEDGAPISVDVSASDGKVLNAPWK